jgi:hypothetical protein
VCLGECLSFLSSQLVSSAGGELSRDNSTSVDLDASAKPLVATATATATATESSTSTKSSSAHASSAPAESELSGAGSIGESQDESGDQQGGVLELSGRLHE